MDSSQVLENGTEPIYENYSLVYKSEKECIAVKSSISQHIALSFTIENAADNLTKNEQEPCTALDTLFSLLTMN